MTYPSQFECARLAMALSTVTGLRRLVMSPRDSDTSDASTPSAVSGTRFAVGADSVFNTMRTHEMIARDNAEKDYKL